ncbi:transcriptional regulator, TetR family [Amphibacillus marinus]|uniref:Transcriptional regulator, TetR family n=1 Tax=Amphibacillus marinus TaxID=872970 RepID=A0A1H8KG15_9BACI|nr:TetR/AcrR family transcriptional regulator [Amphibacillus marinus]SEN91815.1 transcriptional regulator, TetR family [Amphibacillus marinus]
MSKRQERAIRTQQAILKATEELFSTRDFNSVTMREIADKAGCSHTTIYLYYKNKMSLLHELAIEPLTLLLDRFKLIESKGEPDAIIKGISLAYIRFAFEHKSMYEIFLTKAGERADLKERNYKYKVNELRIQLLDSLQRAIERNVPGLKQDEALQHTRMFFYLLHGLSSTYLDDVYNEALIERLTVILTDAIDVMLLGIKAYHSKT